jgi:type I restriction enzyme S subunit
MTKVREGYKETEIGVIPEDWEVKKLYEVLDVRDGTHDSPKQKSEGIPLITSKNLKNGKIDLTEITYISEEDHLSISKRSKVDNGDIIFAMIGTIGNPVIIDLDYEFSIKNVALLKFNKTIISNVLVKNLIDSSIVVNQFAQKRAGGVQKFVSLGLIRNIEIPLPPLQEQQRIAEILSTTDAHIEKLDKTIEDYQLLKKGMMKKLLTEGIGHTEFKETEIGRIPKAWEVKNILEICDIHDSKRKPIKKGDRSEIGGNIPYYGASGIIDYVKDYIFDDELILFGEDGENLRSRNVPLVFRVNGKCWINNHAHVFTIKDKKKDDVNFITAMLEAKDYSPFIVGSAQPKITQGDLKHIYIARPENQEQQYIAEILVTIDEKIVTLQNQRQDFIQLKKILMEKLLTGKIRTTEINEINN